MATSVFIFFVLSVLVSSALSGLVPPEPGNRFEYEHWPSLQGKTVEEVSAEILDQFPTLKIEVRPSKDGIVSDIVANTVFLYEDENGIVVNKPETMIRIPVDETNPVETPEPLVEEPPLEVSQILGHSSESAKDIIKYYEPDTEIDVVSVGDLLQSHINRKKIRLYLDEDGKVIEAVRHA